MNNKSEYRFPEQIKEELQVFGAYLQKQRYKAETIRQKCNYAGLYLLWLESERIKAQDVRYTDLLSLVDHLRGSVKSTKHVNTILISVRNYYEWLKKTERATANPASNLYLRGTRRKIPCGILSYETLEKLYAEYPVTDLKGARNRVILGLIVYQGLTTGELHRLSVHHVKLKEGKLQVPGSGRSHGRILELKSLQVQYMAGHRWVSSTERYRLDNLEGLQAELDKYHPLG